MRAQTHHPAYLNSYFFIYITMMMMPMLPAMSMVKMSSDTEKALGPCGCRQAASRMNLLIVVASRPHLHPQQAGHHRNLTEFTFKNTLKNKQTKTCPSSTRTPNTMLVGWGHWFRRRADPQAPVALWEKTDCRRVRPRQSSSCTVKHTSTSSHLDVGLGRQAIISGWWD